VSSSSTQSNLHPDLFDGTLLEHASTVVAADLCPKGSTTYDNGMSDICANVARTIARKGHVLIPCTISGFLFDLLEDIHLHLNRMGLISQVQYSFVSPVADTALQYSNILAEWYVRKWSQTQRTVFQYSHCKDQRVSNSDSTLLGWPHENKKWSTCLRLRYFMDCYLKKEQRKTTRVSMARFHPT